MHDVSAPSQAFPTLESANDARFRRDFPGQRFLRVAGAATLDVIEHCVPPWPITYWLLWQLAIIVGLASARQDDAQWWLLSEYAWWIAPLVLWTTSPRQIIDSPWLILPMITISWTLKEVWDLLLINTVTWFNFPELGVLESL